MKKLAISISLLMHSLISANGDLYFYPEDKRPTISLQQACVISDIVLKSRGDHNTFYGRSVSLQGSKEQDGRGSWLLAYQDGKGNNLLVHIPFPEGNIKLVYDPKGLDNFKRIELKKSAINILAEQGSARQSTTRSESKSK